MSSAFQQWVMYSNLLVGGVAVGFMLGTYTLLQLPPHWPLLTMGFCGAFLVYQLDRSVFPAPEDTLNQPARVAWAADHRSYVYLSTAGAAALALTMIPLVRPAVWIGAAGYLLLGILYVMPLGRDHPRLKAVHLAKPGLIAGGWVIGGVLLPVLQAHQSITVPILLLMAYRLGFVLPNVLLADWLDRQGDAQMGIQTPAFYFSARTLQRMSQLLLGLTIAGAVAAVTLVDGTKLLIVDLLGPAVMLGLIGGSLSEQRWFYLVTLDAVVAWPAVTAAVGYLAV